MGLAVLGHTCDDSEGTGRNSVLLRGVAYIVEAYPRVFNATGDNRCIQRMSFCGSPAYAFPSADG